MKVTPDSHEAAVNGTTEVAVPVFFGVLTTKAASTDCDRGQHAGKFLGAIGWTVLLCLIFSLVESQLVLPSHRAHRDRGRGKSALGRRWEGFQERVSGGLERFAQERYEPTLRFVLVNRYAALGLALAILLVIFGLLASGRIVFQFFPTVSGNDIYASLELPEGYPVEKTAEALEVLQRSADQLIEELDRELPAGTSAGITQFKTIGLPISKAPYPGARSRPSRKCPSPCYPMKNGVA